MVIALLVMFGMVFALPALAHCPLCTAGAGVAALGARWLGLGSGAIGIFIGAFGLALGLWIARLIRRDNSSFSALLGLGSFFLTVLPLLPLFPEAFPLYLSLGGEYGSLLHRTYAVPWFFVGSVAGALVLAISPFVSRGINRLRGVQVPYQGLVITFVLLLITAGLFELLWRY